MAEEQAIDLENMSLDALLKMDQTQKAAEGGDQQESQDDQQQPRDEQGRFVAKDEQQQQVADQQQEDEVTYRREIDLGDGSGVQVFEADTPDGLINQLAKAQVNATKKIREQQERLRQFTEAEEAQQKQDAQNNDFIISQELMTKPTQAFKKLFKDTVGMEISEFKTKVERVEAFERAQTETAEANTFVTSHLDYKKTDGNAKRVVKWLETFRLPASLENLNKAYEDLKAGGLLELQDPSQVTTDNTSATSGSGRIDPQDEAAATQRRRSSSLSSRGRTAPTQKAELSEDELRSMPLDKLAELHNARARQQ